MNVLEKILEEIEERKKAYHMYLKEVDMIAMLDIRQRMRELNCVEKIIRSHMDEVKNDGWIPVEERLPNEEEFKEAYCRNRYAAEFVVMIEGATRPTTLYYKNGSWFDEERNYYSVVAWQPLPEPYIKNPK